MARRVERGDRPHRSRAWFFVYRGNSTTSAGPMSLTQQDVDPFAVALGVELGAVGAEVGMGQHLDAGEHGGGGGGGWVAASQLGGEAVDALAVVFGVGDLTVHVVAGIAEIVKGLPEPFF